MHSNFSNNMTSREIVKRCIEFRDPPRIGLHFHVMPNQGKVWPVTDFALVGYKEEMDAHRIDGIDEWGLERETIGSSDQDVGQVKNPPLDNGWNQLEKYRLLDFSKPERYAHLKAEVEQHHAEGKYVYGNIPSLMLLSSDIRGMMNWFTDHMMYENELCTLLDIIIDARLKIIKAYSEVGVDGIITWDDMGTHEAPLVSPDIFRSIYFPRYKKTCDVLHEYNMHFIHHCCGQVRPYMDMFVEAGCDVLQLDQPTLMGIDWLSENYGGKICFWNPVDIQKTIGNNDFNAIREEAHHQVWAFGNFNGGFMVKAYEQPDAINMTVEESEAQYQAFLKHSKYPLKPYKGGNKI